jgi:hypothetical protein
VRATVKRRRYRTASATIVPGRRVLSKRSGPALRPDDNEIATTDPNRGSLADLDAAGVRSPCEGLLLPACEAARHKSKRRIRCASGTYCAGCESASARFQPRDQCFVSRKRDPSPTVSPSGAEGLRAGFGQASNIEPTPKLLKLRSLKYFLEYVGNPTIKSESLRYADACGGGHHHHALLFYERRPHRGRGGSSRPFR